MRATEVGTTERRGYDVMFGHNQINPPLTKLTVAQALAAGPRWTRNHGSSAAGGYQFMNKTLAGLAGELGLRGTQVMDPDLQDRLAFHLLKRRGYELWLRGDIGDTEFARRLAMEWASFPVLIPTMGAHRRLQAGQSYYAGDGVNKALVKPEAIYKVLAKARAATTMPPTTPYPKPQTPEAPTEEHWLVRLWKAIFG